MPADECIRCKASLMLQDELELAPVSTQNGEICARCYREITDEELKTYIR